MAGSTCFKGQTHAASEERERERASELERARESERVFQRSPSLLVRWGAMMRGCSGGRAAAWASSGRGQLQQACGFTAV